MEYSGAKILMESLLAQGVEVIFGYPGGQALHIYDALYHYQDRLRHITVSHEQGAVHAADGYARSSGKTGVVFATSGPGATNLVTGIATAHLDSVPLVAITGNVPLDLQGRDSFQEVNIVDITSSIVKKNYYVDDASKIAQVVREAFEVANSGRKGPVLIDIPKDVTGHVVEYIAEPHFQIKPQPALEEKALQQVVEAIKASERPLIYCGGGVTFSDSAEKLQAFAEKLHMPVCMSMMGLSCMPPDSKFNLGLVGMHGTNTANQAVLRCDLLIAVGARFSDRVAGDRKRFAQGARIVHIDIDSGEISKNVQADFSLIGNAGECLEQLTALLPEMKHAEWMHSLLMSKALSHLPHVGSSGTAVDPRELVLEAAEVAGPDAVVVTDVGQHQMLVAQYYPFAKPRSFLSSCGLGTMGYGMGAANGAAVANPGRKVVLFTGDGSFHMNLAELAVAVSNNLPVVVIVMNNHVLGMVYQWQKLFYQGRFSCTEINRKTDFPLLAEAFGAKAFSISSSDQLRPVLQQAFAVEGPCLVDCQIASSEGVFPIVPPGAAAEDMIFSDDIIDDFV